MLPKTSAEQRAPIYNDVRDLIVPGFLTHHVSINGARFVLRTLDSSDWFLLKHRTHGASERDWMAWATASSIWMVDGTVVLGDEHAVFELHRMCLSLPRGILEDLNGILAGLMRRVGEASLRAEAFLYEDESRRLWLSHGTVLKERSEYHGIPRSHNSLLSLWIYFNEMEDERERDDYAWDLAKFSIGPHVPKGIKKIDAKDRQKATDLRAKRQREMDTAYYIATGHMIRPKKETGLAKKGPFQVYTEAHTEEELQDEMRRWVLGEKDAHDLVVESHKARIRNEVESRKAEQEKRRLDLAAAMEEEGFSKSQIIPLVGDSGRAYIERLKNRMPGAARVVMDNHHNSAYDKYIKHEPSAGGLRVNQSGQITTDVPADPRMLDMLTKPTPGETGSLQQQVQSRRPTAFFTEDDEG